MTEVSFTACLWISGCELLRHGQCLYARVQVRPASRTQREVETDVRTRGFSLAVIALFGMHSPAYAHREKSGDHLIIENVQGSCMIHYQSVSVAYAYSKCLNRCRNLNAELRARASLHLYCILTYWSAE